MAAISRVAQLLSADESDAELLEGVAKLIDDGSSMTKYGLLERSLGRKSTLSLQLSPAVSTLPLSDHLRSSFAHRFKFCSIAYSVLYSWGLYSQVEFLRVSRVGCWWA